jgi:glycosyltransferase involved in cell wall biosynthesis
MRNLRVLGVIEKLELFLYRRAARIVSVTHSFRRTLGLRGIDVDKIAVVTNGVDIARFTPRQKDEGVLRALGLQDRFVAGYIGTHGMAHGLDTLLRAAAILKSRPEAARICLLLLGDGARKAELQAEARRLDLDNVVFVDSVPKHQVVNFWSVLDVSIIHLRRTELFTTVIPSKMFECMGMGIPILHGVAGESADIVRREGVGCIFEPESAGELADQLLRMMNDPSALAGYRARCLDSARHYDRSMLADKMLAVIASAIPGTERPRTNT